MDAYGWVMMTLFWMVLLGAVVFALVLVYRSRGSTPVELLDRRLASGEIDAATYREARSALQDRK